MPPGAGDGNRFDTGRQDVTIKPIPARYDGCWFRSTREARWAVFFNTAEIPWEYEPQGYDLGPAGKYLPDFLINAGTHSELFFEVKGKTPAQDELAKAEALCEQSKLPVYVYYEQVRLPGEGLTGMSSQRWNDAMEQRFSRDLAGEFLADPGQAPWPVTVDLHHTWADDCRPTAFRAFTRQGIGYSRPVEAWWTDCPHCGMAVPKLYGQVGHCPARDEDVDYPWFAHETPRLRDAYQAARSYRFGR
jgi:hypothetical protein